MTLRHTSILFLIACLLGGYIWVFENPLRSPNPQTPEDHRVFPEITPHSVTRIEIQRSDQSLHFRKGSDGWEITHPITYPAEASKTEALVSKLAQLSYQSALPANETTASSDEDLYGLQSPQGHITVSVEDADYRLNLGSLSPGNISFVKRSNADQILTLPSEVFGGLEIAADPWRDPRVFPYLASDIDEISVVSAASQVLLKRNEGTRDWRMEKPHPGARLDALFLTQFLQELTELPVTRFVDKQAISPQVTLRLGLASGRNYTLELQAPQNENPALLWAYLPDTDTGITLPTMFARQIVDPAKAFRNPYLLDPGFEFESIEFRGEERFTLSKDSQSGLWWITQPNRLPADQRLVAQCLYQLVELRINGFVTDMLTDEAEYGVDFPFKSLTFVPPKTNAPDAQAPTPLVVRFGFESRNHFMTHRSDETSIYAVPFGAVRQLPKRAYELRNRRLWPSILETFSRVRVKKPDTDERVWTRANGNWQIDDEALGSVESAAFDELIDQLRSVQAEAWTGQGNDLATRYGIGKRAMLTLESTETGTDTSYTLQFGSITPSGHRYAMTDLQGTTTLFEFPGTLYVKLNQVLGLEPDPDE